ncbi:response regulator receiver domain [Aeromonas veronii]
MEATAVDTTVTPNQIWSEHCLSAVKMFVKNAVVIDNEPVLVRTNSSIEVSAAILNQPDSTGMGGLQFDVGDSNTISLLTAEPSDSIHDTENVNTEHPLDVRLVSDAFAEAGIACSFVLPCNEDDDEELKVHRILSAAKLADIVIIDWYLHNNSPTLTMRVLRELANADRNDGERLRLIAVYTGQLVTNEIFSDIKESLSQGGVNVDNIEGREFIAKNNSCLVLVLSKAEISPAALPEKLFNSFSLLSDGLIPSFALAAVGAIRKNMHHLVTRFAKDLDSAYISNRLITNPSGDVAELMRELLVSEFDSAIGLEKVADHYLDDIPVKKWIENSNVVAKDYRYRRGEEHFTQLVDKGFIIDLLESGIGDDGFRSRANDAFIPFPTKDRHIVSVAIAGNEELSKKNQNIFSRLVTFKREAVYGGHDNDWKPSLTTGTLLKMEGNDTYLLCLTPACDTLRLSGSSSFVFLEARACASKYSVIFKDENGVDIKLKFERKRPKMSTFSFSPDETERVRGTLRINAETSVKTFHFISDGQSRVEFTWMGEIRYSRAASEMAQLVGNWMRIGINDSEYLRLIDAGRFPG